MASFSEYFHSTLNQKKRCLHDFVTTPFKIHSIDGHEWRGIDVVLQLPNRGRFVSTNKPILNASQSKETL